MKLDFIIIGGQKCGSTYLHSVISQHPDIAMPKGECPHLESPDYENGGLGKLERLLLKLDQEKMIGIKRPNYLAKEEVKGRINTINNQIKLIAILRNPFERLKSAYFHQMNNGFAPILPLNEGIQKLLQGELKIKYPRTEELLEFGLYAKHLKKYIEEYKDNVLILFYDDLNKNKLDVIRKCYSFLEVDDQFIPDDQFLNSRPQKVNYSLFRTRLLTVKNKYRYQYTEDRTRLSTKNQSKLDKFVCRAIDFIDGRIISKLFPETKKPEFNTEIAQELTEIYSSDIKKLESLCKVDLSHWINSNT